MWYFRRRRRWLYRRPVVIRGPGPATRKSEGAEASEVFTEKPEMISENRIPIPASILSSDVDFSLHISRYKGQTVTVFVSAGGAAGLGFTGILYFVNDAYIRLIINPGSVQACSLGNSCSNLAGTAYASPGGTAQTNLTGTTYASPVGASHANLTGAEMLQDWAAITQNSAVYHPGTVVAIPTSRITAFVHNSI